MLIQFPADLGDPAPEIVHHQIVCGFTIEIGIALDHKGYGYVVMGGIFRNGFIVLGAAAMTEHLTVLMDIESSYGLQRLPHSAAEIVADNMLVELGARILIDPKGLLIDALVARSAQENPNVLMQAHLN